MSKIESSAIVVIWVCLAVILVTAVVRFTVKTIYGKSGTEERTTAYERISQPTLVEAADAGDYGMGWVVKIEDVYYFGNDFPMPLGSSNRAFGLRRAIIRQERGDYEVYLAAIVLPGTEIKPNMVVKLFDVRYVVNDRGNVDEFRVAIPH